MYFDPRNQSSDHAAFMRIKMPHAVKEYEHQKRNNGMFSSMLINAEWYSRQKNAYEAVGYFPELPSGENVKVDNYARLSEQILPWSHENTKALSNMALNCSGLSCNQIYQYARAPQLKQCHLQPPPPAYFGFPMEAMFYDNVQRERLPKLSLTPLKRSHSFQQQEFHVAQVCRPSKRVKAANEFHEDDWSMDAIIPFLEQWEGILLDGQDNTKKMNSEVLRFKEFPTTAITLNSTADNEGSKSPNVCFTNLLNLVQSPEDCINSTTLNKETLSSIVEVGISQQTSDDDCDNKIIGNDDAISHPEEPKMVDKHSEMGFVETCSVKTDVTFSPESLTSDGFSVLPEESPIDEGQNTELMIQPEQDKREAKYVCGRKLEDSKVSGVSLTDSFEADQIEEHLYSLNPSLNSESKKKLGGKITAPVVGEDTCQLCVQDRLTFVAPAIPCASCGARIVHKSFYYWSVDEVGTRSCFCTRCFKGSRVDVISLSGRSIPKAALYKDQNTEESTETWVQCDKCEQWQHQICALYNSEQDFKGKVEYTCPFCRLTELEAKACVPIHPPASGARDLPRTKLSDHIEQRLFRSLEQERKQRAEILGKPPEEVLGASDLSVRVVLDTNKQLKVKKQFLDILPSGTYPTEFQYKSKVILLFQKIEGVDVCLFAMYVQEFGSECSIPNKRSVYISYLDSVKYFRPDIKTNTGVALRTFVYHELLIGYLDYCKKHGFATCYIWSCPSLRGDDYILNCHPENQKRPNSNKLVQWYKKMIKKAKAENVVVGSTNFYDHFFVPSAGSNSKTTAAQLPYFDGDYWSAAIEDILQTIGESSGRKPQKTKRYCKSMGHSDLSVDSSKDFQVMQKLGQKILTVKEEIMVIQLQFNCTNCNEAILSGGYWSCNQCSKYHLCGRCLESYQFPSGMEMHSDIRGEKHPLCLIPLKAAAITEIDEIEDRVLDNNIFDSRHAFLEFCEKNNYQFDMLRRAKHSSMMILHHLQTSTSTSTETVPVFSEVETMQNLLRHASQCHPTKDSPCLYPKCAHIKKFFLHSRECKSRANGGCNACKKIWRVLFFHSKNCTDSCCKVPRCMDIKDHKKTTTMSTKSNLIDC